jgi:non-ribosomal peptide synthetase component F
LGIVYAGGFYSLLDPDFPDERHASQLKTLSPELLITEPETLAKIEPYGEWILSKMTDYGEYVKLFGVD